MIHTKFTEKNEILHCPPFGKADDPLSFQIAANSTNYLYEYW